MKMTWIYDS